MLPATLVLKLLVLLWEIEALHSKTTPTFNGSIAIYVSLMFPLFPNNNLQIKNYGLCEEKVGSSINYGGNKRPWATHKVMAKNDEYKWNLITQVSTYCFVKGVWAQHKYQSTTWWKSFLFKSSKMNASRFCTFKAMMPLSSSGSIVPLVFIENPLQKSNSPIVVSKCFKNYYLPWKAVVLSTCAEFHLYPLQSHIALHPAAIAL